MAAPTTNEAIYHHYTRPEVREAILKYVHTSEGWRVLNGDFDQWYQYDKEDGSKRLNQPEDYEKLIARHKVVYATLAVFEESLKKASLPRGGDKPLGTFRDCRAYSPGVDIDLLAKDLNDPENIRALEISAQFFIDYLKENGIIRSVKALFSVGGAYIIVDHRLFQAQADWTPEDRERVFWQLTRCFDYLIKDIADSFFQKYPEYRTRVKFDSLNNRKRLFKTIFSVHRSAELNHRHLAVIPIDIYHIRIDPSNAALPLSDDILALGQHWYDQYDLAERKLIVELLGKYLDQVLEEQKAQSKTGRPGDIFVSPKPLLPATWPPCARNILEKVAPGRGPHRSMAVLAEFLGQAGIRLDDSLKIWMDAARKGEVNDRVDIFYTYYRQFPCPLCRTLKRKADGYPKQGLGDLDYCQPDDLCGCVHWPIEYARLKAARIALDEFDARVKKDPGAVYEPEMLRWLKEVYESNPQEWERVKKILRRRRIAVKDLIAELEDGEEKNIPLLQTPFVELDDGRLAEMVVQDGAAKFAVYDAASQRIEYHVELEHDGIVIVPPKDDEIFLKGYVTLPSIAEDYGDEMRLYSEIRAFIHKYLEVSEDFETIACFYPMLTWVYDVMSVIVYLRAKGDWGTGKSRFLKVFSVLCYRAVSATGAISEAPIYRVVDRWRGTLTLDEADFDEKTDASASITKILNCGYERGKPVIRCDSNDPEVVHVFDPFGPKILATRFAFKDKALESRCFTELMKERTRKEIPIDLPPAFFEEALALRNELLMYRFKNRNEVKERSERGDLGATFVDLPDRMQQAARPLSIIVGNHPELQAMLKKFLEEKAKALVLEASETIEGHIVKILADEEPEPNSDVLKWDLTISNIFERIKAEFGDIKLKSGQVRNRANSLGLKTKRDYVDGKRQRIITCDKSLFDRLKRRYIPDEPDICYPGPDSPYWGCEIIWDDLDDLDNDGGCQGKNARNTDGRGLKPEREENEREERAQDIGNGARIFDPTPRDRPDCPDRPTVPEPGEKTGIGPYPRKNAPTPTKKKPEEPIFCAVCAANLAGHGTVEKNGKIYCAKPGCGYPSRGRATAETGTLDEDDPATTPHFCYLNNLKNYAIIMRYGLGGWIDPMKLSANDKVSLPVCLVMKGLDHLGYERYERSGGGIGYRQKKAGSPGRAEA